MDRSFFSNPISKYLQWLICKIKYQYKYRDFYLRIGYNSIVRNVRFGKYNWIGQDAFIIDSEMGNYTYLNNRCLIFQTSIGKYCSLGPGAMTSPGKHPTSNYVSTHPLTYYNPSNLLISFNAKTDFKYSEKVVIGNDVWIGANAIIVDGITVGDGAIVAANSVVTKNVAPYSIVAGVPAQHQRFRFTEEEIAFLLQFKWWNNDEEWIKKNIQYFSSIQEFRVKAFNQ